MLETKNESSLNTIEADSKLPTKYGNFRIRAFTGPDGKEHSVLYTGNLSDPNKIPIVRIHSECLTGDAFGSLKCDCGPQLESAMIKIQEEGCGAIVYLRQEGRGIGLYSKIQAYALQDQGHDTLDANLLLDLPADDRNYDFASTMMESVGLKKIRLLTNNPLKLQALESNGIKVVERQSIVAGVNEQNKFYLSTKAKRMGHHLEV